MSEITSRTEPGMFVVPTITCSPTSVLTWVTLPALGAKMVDLPSWYLARLRTASARALVDCLPFLDGELDDLTVDLGGDVHFRAGLDDTGPRDHRHDVPAAHLRRVDGIAGLFRPADRGDDHDRDHRDDAGRDEKL